MQMKNNSGITMIELVVVIIIIMIIATIAIVSGQKTLDEADVTEVYSEIDTMKKVVNEISLRKSTNPDIRIEEGVYYDMKFVPLVGVTYGTNVTNVPEDWYIIYGSDQLTIASQYPGSFSSTTDDLYKASTVKENLGLEGINHTYIVNFEECEVELYKPIVVGNTSVRTYSEIRNLAK